MKRIWIIIAGGCAIIAVVLLVIGKNDGAFVIGAIGVLAWFLNLRRDLKTVEPMGENIKCAERETHGEQDED